MVKLSFKQCKYYDDYLRRRDCYSNNKLMSKSQEPSKHFKSIACCYDTEQSLFKSKQGFPVAQNDVKTQLSFDTFLNFENHFKF